jgi:magnesium transporter
MPVSKELLRRLQLELDEAPADLAARLAHAPAVDAAEVLNRLRLADAAAVIVALPLPRAAELFDQLALQRRGRLLAQVEAVDVERAAGILEQLSADERTDVAREMGEHARRRLLPKLSAPIRAEVEQLLRYPDHSAGGIMTTEFVRLDPRVTVGQALKHIRAVAGEKETIYACYIVEPETGRLLGAVSLRDLVMGELDQPVTEVMRHHPITVEVLADQESVAQKIAKYNLLAVPVLERDGRVVGFVTVDDVIDVMIEEQTEDLLRMAAVEPGALDKPYFENSIFRVVRKRIGWLLLLFVAETFTGTVLRHFEGELAAVVALSFFIPLLIGTGGNAGAQTVTTIIRSIALGEIRLRTAGGSRARGGDRTPPTQ